MTCEWKKYCTVNYELISEPVCASLPIKKLSKTQRNRVSLQFTDNVFGIPTTLIAHPKHVTLIRNTALRST